MKTHHLKIWPQFFVAIDVGAKRYEIRMNEDRDFQVGDWLHLQEYDPESGQYTGRELMRRVTYMTEGGEWGLPHNIVVMSIV